MPRENRKRGKKNKKKAEHESLSYETQPAQAEPERTGEPSWIRAAPLDDPEVPEINPEAPFGYVDADIKAYFPLTEMGGKEKQLATDPDCSVILERMAYSMDDFVRRVFMDSLTGSFEILARHRFASHVCQTLLSVASETISRESRGVFPTIPETSGKGELRTLTQLVLDAAEELVPSFPSLIMDPFASHVVRALLALLSPTVSASSHGQGAMRSKKSAAWKARQGPMMSVFTDEKGKGKEVVTQSRPAEFRGLAKRLVDVLRAELGENEVRALAANKVASPGLQMLLDVEADCGMTSDPDSLMDRVMVGIISACGMCLCWSNVPLVDSKTIAEDLDATVEPSDYLNTLLRDPTSSHLLETIVTRSPDHPFAVLWATYFNGKLARLANHPVANFVLAKALERASVEQLSEACTELEGTWSKLITSSRSGVLRAAVDRSATIQAAESLICEAVYSAFDLASAEDRTMLVPCVLHLLPLQEYKASSNKEEVAVPQRHGRPGAAPNDSTGPKVQGSVLLQSLLRLPAPYNDIVIANIAALPMEERIKMAHDASGSRVYDALLESPTVTPKVKREFVMGFIGHYHLLVDDRLGSRVGDRCWAFADTYLKEKIGRSLIIHEQFLAGSFYGKFFARNLNLYLLQRRPDEWKTMQADRKRVQDALANPTQATPVPPTASGENATDTSKKSAKRKRHNQTEDEIDAVFNASLGIKKAALSDVVPISTLPDVEEKVFKKNRAPDNLQAVLGAIQSAPKDNKGQKKKRRH
ncbi:hypothetical protein DXG01_015805 [Tephrocybe rancida]|nr:hypothetical protein DXG01_015805 [Tephrocybe rancida]